ncbi:MAG TPA: hypothetical protein VG889_11025 [Rhizomicrobium sp.]|nr:hypothetical protein [Rhizomicrobium sp.]
MLELLVDKGRQPDYLNEFVRLAPSFDPSGDEMYDTSFGKVTLAIFGADKALRVVLDSDKQKPIGPIKVRFDQIVAVQQSQRTRFGAVDVTTLITTYPDFESLSVWDVAQGLYRNLRAAQGR